MPVVITNVNEDEAREDAEGLLYDAEGKLTLEGQLCSEFLEDVDFDPLFEDPEIREAGIIKSEDAFFIDKDGELIPAKEGDAGAEAYNIETIEPEDLVQVLDDEDLAAMFEYFVENELPSETLEDKARLAAARQIAGLDEGPYKKGEFRKMRKKPGGVDKVARMLLAMLHKESIKRAGKGKGYKGGDYKRSKGYAPGTSAGIARYQKHVAGKGKVAKAKAEKKAAKYKKGKKKAAPKKGAVKKMAKKGEGKIAASEEPKPRQISEGAGLAGDMLKSMRKSSLVEEEKKEK